MAMTEKMVCGGRRIRTMVLAAILVVVSLASIGLGDMARWKETPEQRDARIGWWREARFGMFIHWGVYSVPGGIYNGKDVRGGAEWILQKGQIPIKEYEKYCSEFNPVKFDADAWAQMAADAGMKYLVITSKHHDGFCLWDSKVGDYDIMDRTPFKRDILAELAKACKRHGVRLCFYHSIMDWHHPDYLPRRSWEDRSAEGADYQRYVRYMKAQLKEIITGYDPAVLWFDGEWESTWTHEDGLKLYDYVRSLKPDILVNNRVDKGRHGMRGIHDANQFAGDFGTPEQEIPATGLPGYDWETCMTMNTSWGFKKNDQHWKSTETLVRNLVDIASKGGNFLLNIGPKPDGTFPQASIKRLAEIGKWMKVYGESIYGTMASPFERLAWGRCTKKESGQQTTLYLHVFEWPENGKLLVPGLKLEQAVSRAYLLEGGKVLKAKTTEDGLVIQVPKAGTNAIDTVIVVELVGGYQVVKLVPGQQADGSVVLTAEQAVIHNPNGANAHLETRYGGSTVGYWLNAGTWVEWPFQVKQSGDYTVMAELAIEAGQTAFQLEVQGQKGESACKVKGTGGYGTFKMMPLGKISIKKGGEVTLLIKPQKGGWNPMNVRKVVLKPAQ